MASQDLQATHGDLNGANGGTPSPLLNTDQQGQARSLWGNLPAPLQGFARLPAWRQISIIVGLAATIALVVGSILWSQEPEQKPLYNDLSQQEAAEIVAALERTKTPYHIDTKNGAILVPAEKVHETRLRLANEGLPKASLQGFEMLDHDRVFGTSQFMENARYQRALEGELARSITTIESIESARVHLAMPKQSVFLRDQQYPSASILVQLKKGRVLDPSQVAAVVHLVASSIPNLANGRVSIIDQQGRLLTDDHDKDMLKTTRQLRYVQTLEESYNKKIETILSPIFGMDKVRAQVKADIDFSETEKTQETFNPDITTVRSEQTHDEYNEGLGITGVPGALTNQPPGGGVAPEVADRLGKDKLPNSTKREATRNYEVDRTISRTQNAHGDIQRLTVAVLVDHKTVINAKGASTREPLTAAELDQVTSLVKDAVGFNSQRGDSIHVINESFIPLTPEEMGVVRFWNEPWFWRIAKQMLATLAVLALIFGVLRPLLKVLAGPEEVVENVIRQAEKPEEPESTETAGELTDQSEQPAGLLEALEGLPEGTKVLEDGTKLLPDGTKILTDGTKVLPDGTTVAGGAATEGGSQPALPPTPYDEKVNMIKALVQQNPKLVAEVLKGWVGGED